MSLNIKDPEAHRLAQTLASMTGDSITRAVIDALQERLERVRGNKNNPEALASDIRRIAERAAPHVKRPYLPHGEFLYDERGLPK